MAPENIMKPLTPPVKLFFWDTGMSLDKKPQQEVISPYYNATARSRLQLWHPAGNGALPALIPELTLSWNPSMKPFFQGCPDKIKAGPMFPHYSEWCHFGRFAAR